jgi:hypothetical protein
LYWEALRNGYKSDKISSQQAAQMASDNLVSMLGINPYGSGYSKPVGTDGKLLPEQLHYGMMTGGMFCKEWLQEIRWILTSVAEVKSNYFFSLGIWMIKD